MFKKSFFTRNSNFPNKVAGDLNCFVLSFLLDKKKRTIQNYEQNNSNESQISREAN